MAQGWRIVTHGGAGSDPSLTDATRSAGEVALEALQDGIDPLAAACRTVAHLEDDGRFNAGVGSNLRDDGRTVQMDAACADSTGRFGAVACIEQIENPVLAAREVTETEHAILAGEGARRFAIDRGLETFDPGEVQGGREEAARDTVGCVLGDVFAAALSSGGTREAMVGRVGDVPLPGCGLRAGASGAIAATGDGEAIAADRTADRAYALLEAGHDGDEVVERVLEGFGDELLGLIVVDERSGAGGSNASMAYSQIVD